METHVIAKLRRSNLIAGVFHTVQFVAVALLSNDFALPVTATYMAGPPGSAFADPVTLFSLPLGFAVAGFFALSAIAHFIVATGKFNTRYNRGLTEHRNFFRWVEYSLSSSLMIVLIAQICGIADITALVALFGVNASMIFFGWLQEKYIEPGTKDLLPFWFGCIAGVVPWIAISIYVISPGGPAGVNPPGFVYGIVFSLFALFNSFALVQYLQYRAKGKWADYLRGERTYIVLSLVAKSLLAWQIFANTLIP